MDPRALAVLFIVFAGLSLYVLRRLFLMWQVERRALAELGQAADDERVTRVRRLGRRLMSLVVALLAMVALAFAAPLGAPRPLLDGLQVLAIAALAAGIYWSLKT